MGKWCSNKLVSDLLKLCQFYFPGFYAPAFSRKRT